VAARRLTLLVVTGHPLGDDSSMPEGAPHIVHLPSHRIDLHGRRVLRADGSEVTLRPQAMDLLCDLARHAGEVVTKRDLLDRVWPDMVVTDDSLVQAVGDARRAIGDERHAVIQTVPRRGYRLIAAAAPLPAVEAVPAVMPDAMKRSEGWRMGQSYRFAEIEVRPDERQVLVGGRPAALHAKAFDLLLALVERRDRVVPRAELYDTVWAGRVVEDNNLAVQVHSLRKLLGERCVVTVPGRGYRFALAEDSAPAPRQAAAHEPVAARSPAAIAPSDAQVQPAAEAPVASPLLPATLLPLSATALHGRDDDLAAIDQLLARHRLVTVVGPGGIGKTVFARSAAHAAARQGLERSHGEPSGAVWIELAQVLDAALLPSTWHARSAWRWPVPTRCARWPRRWLSAAACCSSQAVGINVDSSTPTVAVVWSAMNQAPCGATQVW
jgi:DNA-binding winged helix-turn-helix (wHTH) protein